MRCIIRMILGWLNTGLTTQNTNLWLSYLIEPTKLQMLSSLDEKRCEKVDLSCYPQFVYRNYGRPRKTQSGSQDSLAGFEAGTIRIWLKRAAVETTWCDVWKAWQVDHLSYEGHHHSNIVMGHLSSGINYRKERNRWLCMTQVNGGGHSVKCEVWRERERQSILIRSGWGREWRPTARSDVLLTECLHVPATSVHTLGISLAQDCDWASTGRALCPVTTDRMKLWILRGVGKSPQCG
jgi:hypothetical protein